MGVVGPTGDRADSARTRLRWWGVGAAIAVAAGVIGLSAATLPAGDRKGVRVAAGSVPTTVTARSGSVTAPETTAPPTSGLPVGTTSTPGPSVPPVVTTAPPPTPVVTTAPGSAPTTRPTDGCRNAYDRPECGPFHWDPEPAPNQPPSITILSVTPEQARAGEPVTVRVRVEDPDSPFSPTSCQNRQDWGDGTMTAGDSRGTAWCSADPEDCLRQRNGPHDPPEPQPSSFTVDLSHTYGSAGTYTASLQFSAFYSCDSPYSERATVNVEITVTEPSLIG